VKTAKLKLMSYRDLRNDTPEAAWPPPMTRVRQEPGRDRGGVGDKLLSKDQASSEEHDGEKLERQFWNSCSVRTRAGAAS
jgi:hypothetical protein